MHFPACPRNSITGKALGAALVVAVLCLPASGAIAQQAAAGKLQVAPLPPPRPASLGPRTETAAATLAVPAATTPSASREPLTDRAGVDLLNAYFNSYPVLSADFIQVGADGRRYEGKLYIQRPGKMRFEYKAPATIEIIADGTSVAIRDRRLATQDLYTIGQTPLKFLLKDKIDLARDTTIKDVSSTRDAVTIQLEDKATLGGTSKIALQYDRVANVLRQWTIVDPQGYETSVSIFNVDTQRRHNQALFAINYERVLEDKK
jgi:outer membrane lipoprotein-sorting protein